MSRTKIIMGLAAILALPTVTFADKVTARGPTRQVTVTGVTDCELVYRMGASESQTPLLDVKKIVLDGRDDFNAAEEAFSAGQLDQALQSYDQALRNAREPWQKDLIDIRRVQVMNGLGRLDRALTVWEGVHNANRGSANSMALMPTTPGAVGSPANARAIDILTANRPETDTSEKDRAVTALLMTLYRLEGMDAAIEAERVRAGGEVEADVVVEEDPAEEEFVPLAGDIAQRLDLAERLLTTQVDPARAAAAVEADLDDYDTDLLPRALWVLGSATKQLAEQAEGDQARELLIKAGVYLMHVPAYFPRTPEAPKALFEAAQVNWALGNRLAARRTYEAIRDGYKANPDRQTQQVVEQATAALAEMEQAE